MSLFGVIQNSANALQVAELGLHVVGNNVANAGTPGYIRQELNKATGPAYRYGSSILGSGVRAVGVVQKLDSFLLERMREVRSDLESSDRLGQLYQGIEDILGELNENDLSTKMNEFSSSIQDLLNHPGNDALRRLVIEQGKSLASDIRSVSQSLGQFGANLNSEISQTAGEINRLTNRIANLNQRIVELEGGREAKTSDAVGLRDERIKALDELSSFVNIRTGEQESGAVSVFVGGEYLVTDGITRAVKVELQTVDGQTYPEVRLADTDSPLEATGGRLHGIYSARELAVGGIGKSLDTFALTLMDQFNSIHTQGQGSVGFSEVASVYATDDVQGPLDLAGYRVGIRNGQFQVQVSDLASGAVVTHNIRVQLTGATDDTSLEDIAGQLNAVSGLSASIGNDGRLTISADSHKLRFSFQNDSSNFLSAAGINTFFVGDSASNLQVNTVVANDPKMFAASLTGIGLGTGNAVRLAKAFEEPLEGLGGQSLKQAHEDMVVRITQDVSLQSGKSDGLRNFYQTLEAQHLGISGVNLDEEAIKMIFYQRMFQANSKIIQTSSEMLDVLVNL